MTCNTLGSQSEPVEQDDTHILSTIHQNLLCANFVKTCVSVVTVNDDIQRTVTSVLTQWTLPMFYQLQLSNLTSCPLHDKTVPD
jgi:hypothetical protein